jgi:small subunit ribosomal protein S8
MKNYLWNMFANLKNGQLAKRNFIYQTRKKICENFLKILWDEGFITGYTIDSKEPNKLKIFLKYKNGRPVINSIKLITKPSKRVFWSVKQIWKIDSSKNFIIFSTSKGLKSLVDCKKFKIGGEPFITIN